MTYFLHLCMLPHNLLIGWPITMLLWLVWGDHSSLRVEHGMVLTFEYRVGSKGDETDYSTTLGYGVAYQPTRRGYAHVVDTTTDFHEGVHIHQMQDLAFRGSLVCALCVAAGAPILGLVLWTLSPAMLLTNYLTAVLRGEPMYRGATHEKHAYAATELWAKNRD